MNGTFTQRVKKVNLLEVGTDHQLRIRVFYYCPKGDGLHCIDFDLFPENRESQIPIERVGIEIT